MRKKRLLQWLVPLVLFSVIAALIVYPYLSGDGEGKMFGHYSPASAKAFLENLTFEDAPPAGKKQVNGSKSWYEVAQQGEMSLWLDPMGGMIAISDGKGKTWLGNPSDDVLAEDPVKGLWKSNLASPFTYKFVPSGRTSPEQSNTVDVETEVSWRPIDGGVGVRYTIPERGFIFYFEYTLTEKGMRVHMPELGVLETKDNLLVSVDVLPFFAAAPKGTEGYLFVPDGPGGLIYFNKKRLQLTRAYHYPVFGDDSSIPPIGKWFPRSDIAFPVFGMNRSDGGFLAIIEEGQFKANIYAAPSGIDTGFSNVNASFSLRRIYDRQVGLSQTKTDYEDQMMTEPITVSYLLLDQHEADYVGMGKTYREYLVSGLGLKSLHTSGEPPLFLDFLMAATEPTPLSDKTVVVTTFGQAGDIVNDLRERGVTRMEIGVGGWNKGGYPGSLPKKFPMESKIGGEEGLVQFAELVHANGNKLRLIDDYTRAVNKMGNGFSPSKDAARNVNNASSKQEQEGNWQNATQYFYSVKPSIMGEQLRESLDQLKGMPIDGLALSDLGHRIYSDFDRNSPYDRKMSAEVYKDLLDETKKAVGSATTSGANAYVIGFADHMNNFPIETNYDLIVDVQVPFYPIAVHGLLTYSAAPGNDRADPQVDFLRAIEYGTQPLFVVTNDDPRELKRTNYLYLYSSQYTALADRIVSEYERFAEANSDVWGIFIDGHRKIAEGVYETSYENGRKVWVNYNKKPFSAEGLTVEGLSFKVIAQGGSQ